VRIPRPGVFLDRLLQAGARGGADARRRPPGAPRAADRHIRIFLILAVLAGFWRASPAAPPERRPAAARPETAAITLRGPYRYEQGWYHRVRMGETLPVLASRFGVDVRYLARVNHLEITSGLKEGSYLYVPPRSGHYHTAAAGETLDSIAARYRLDPDYLAASNRLSRQSRLRPGQALVIPTRARPLPITGREENAAIYTPGESRSLAPSAPAAPAAPPSESVRAPASASGLASATGSGATQVARPPAPEDKGGAGAAGRASSAPGRETQPAPFAASRSGESSNPPKPAAPKPPAATPSSSSRRSGGGSRFQWPLEGTVTRGFINKADAKHTGLDIAAPEGTLIRAAADGKVIYSGDDIPSYGKMVILDHGDGFATCYAHNSANLVRQNEKVRAGDPIARAGQTGRATGPHLHFEVRRNYESVDPLPHLP